MVLMEFGEEPEGFIGTGAQWRFLGDDAAELRFELDQGFAGGWPGGWVGEVVEVRTSTTSLSGRNSWP
jgi:hypothetical protein